MRKTLLTSLSVLCCAFVYAQEPASVTVYQNYEHVHVPSMIYYCQVDGGAATNAEGKEVNPRRRPNAYFGTDPDRQVDTIVQVNGGSRATILPIINQDGMVDGYTPQDPSGAKGPNHFVQVINSSVEIFDNSGVSVLGPTSLASFIATSNNDGDPVVIYDNMADRWFISAFGSANNSLGVGVSATNDPLGAWDFWSFSLPQFPDYPKYSVWSDGYYVSGNFGSQNTMAMDRAAMLNGDPSITSIVLSTPNMGSSGFRMALPVDQDGGSIPSRPAMIISANDDNWSQGQPTDHVKIWEFAPDWVTPSNSTLTELITLPVSSFDGIFPGSGWCNIEQPGIGPSLDAIGDGLMLPATWRDFGTHESIVCCHAVDASGTGISGIRWYELRDTGAGWVIYQEGTYAPSDGNSRWMGSIGIDQFGNISIAYSVSGPNTYPSVRCTGRYESDPLGTMTITECPLVDGTSAINESSCRFGDYAHMTVDPEDGITFWFTGEYFGGGQRRTRIASWQLGTLDPIDLGVTIVTAPASGVLTATENVTVTVKNFGTEDQSNFDVSYTLNGGTVVTEAYSGTIVSNGISSYTFASVEDMSAYGNYDIVAWTTIAGDGFAMNDTTVMTVTHYTPDDVGVSAMVVPITDQLLSNSETVTVTISNFGSVDQSNFPVTMIFNGGAPITETVIGTVPAQGTLDFTFAATVDLETVATYTYFMYTGLTGDFDNSNDTLNTTTETLTPTYCIGISEDCVIWDDYIGRVRLNNIDNISVEGPDCFDDFTSQTIMVVIGNTYDLGVTVFENNHFVSVWIDYNQNYEFDATELVIDAFSCPNLGVESVTPFLLGLSTAQGTFRIRFRTVWEENGPLDPCAPIDYGETEDYMIEISAWNGIDDLNNSFETLLYTNKNNSQVAVINGVADVYNVRLIDARGRILKRIALTHSGGNNEYILPTQYLVSGTYMILIENSKGDRLTEKVVIVR